MAEDEQVDILNLGELGSTEIAPETTDPEPVANEPEPTDVNPDVDPSTTDPVDVKDDPPGQDVDPSPTEPTEQAVPYTRFQEVNEQRKEYEAQLESLKQEKAQYEAYFQQAPGSQQTQQNPLLNVPDAKVDPVKYQEWQEKVLAPAMNRDFLGTLDTLMGPRLQEREQQMYAQFEQYQVAQAMEAQAKSWNEENKDFITSMDATEKEWLDGMLTKLNPSDSELINVATELKGMIEAKRGASKVSSVEAKEADLRSKATEQPDRGNVEDGPAYPDPSKYPQTEQGMVQYMEAFSKIADERGEYQKKEG